MYPQTLKIRTNSFAGRYPSEGGQAFATGIWQDENSGGAVGDGLWRHSNPEQIIRQMHMTELFTDILRNNESCGRVDTISILV